MHPSASVPATGAARDVRLSVLRHAPERGGTTESWTGRAEDLFGRRHLVRRSRLSVASFAPVASLGDGAPSATAVVLDHRHVDPEVAEEVMRRASAFASVVYTAWEHEADGPEDCGLRVVVPLARPVRPSDYALLWGGLRSELGGYADRDGRGLARLWLLPACPPERAERARLVYHGGPLIDPDEFLGPRLALDFVPGLDALGGGLGR